MAAKTQTNNDNENARIELEALSGLLTGFGLKHAAKDLAELMQKAAEKDETYRQFLNDLLQHEVKGRNARNRSRNYSAAHFPDNPRELSEFDPTALSGGITSPQIHELEDLNWVDAHGNLIFVGNPGLGKTMLAVGFGVHAVNEGYTVTFETMESFVKLLDNESTERKSGFRMKNIRRADLVIIDEIGYTPITRPQANKFYNFISAAHGKQSLIFTTNKAVKDWAEILGDKDLTAALLDRIISRSRCFLLTGTSYRLAHPEVF